LARERRLFERLAEPDPTESRRRDPDIRALTESVIVHLNRLMNSRHGCTPIQADYGIPDLNEFVFSFPDSLGAMRKAVQKAIEQYEPRLKAVRIKYIEEPDRPLDIHFEITARMVVEGKTIPVTYNTSLGSAAGIKIVE
jgi:type VI secretion system protein